MDRDDEHLKLLSIFHYVVGGLAALGACIPVIHLVVGIFLIGMANNPDPQGDVPPAFLGWIFVSVASMIIIFGWIIAGCIIATGRFLAQRKNYTLCLVVAGVECLFMPLGTILGIFTLVVLTRDSVKQAFQSNEMSGPAW